MRRMWISVLIGVVALGLGIGAAAGAAFILRKVLPGQANIVRQLPQSLPTLRVPELQPRKTKDGGNSPYQNWRTPTPAAPVLPKGQQPNRTPGVVTRITIDQAAQNGRRYLESYPELRLGRVMEFESSFYVLALEKSTGRGGLELMVNPFSGVVSLGTGPAMMWNRKYGRMGRSESGSLENALSMEKAYGMAQQALEKRSAGVTMEKKGTAFYGYYTFTCLKDGKPVGWISVEGQEGQVWMNTNLGKFIASKEFEK